MMRVDADGFRNDYQRQVQSFRQKYADECAKIGVDFLPLDTSMPFDKALAEYLTKRRGV